MTDRSFAALAKQEICTNPLAQSMLEAELAAATLGHASLTTREGQITLRYRTESEDVAQRIAAQIRSFPAVQAAISRHGSRFLVTTEDGQTLAAGLGISLDPLLPGKLPATHLRTRRGRVACVRGAFLAGGTVSNPNKGYHLEFVTAHPDFAALLSGILTSLGLEAKISQRKGSSVIYLNEGDSIASLLALIGAHSSILDLENVRILKETRNNVNRAVNCETANINKTVDAAIAQIRSIELIEKKMGLAKLSATLQEAAKLRLQYPEATLQELCELSGTTKSGMNHRLRKINAIARDITGEEL